MAKAFSDLLNWYGLIDNGVVLCKDGTVLAGWYLEGIDTEPMDGETVAAHTDILARVIGEFGEDDGFWVDLARRPLQSYRTAEYDFAAPVLQELERERAAYFETSDNNYANRITLVYQWMPPRKHKTLESCLKAFEPQRKLVEDRFSALYKMKRMGKRVDRDDHHDIPFARDELMGRLVSSLQGRFSKVNIPSIPCYLDRVVATEWHHGNPQSLPLVNGRPMAVIAIDGFPKKSSPEVLKFLEMLPVEYQWTTRFLPMDRIKAARVIKKKANDWAFAKTSVIAQASKEAGQVNNFAAQMAAEARAVVSELDGGDLRFGDFTSIITIFGDFGQPEEQISTIANSVIEVCGAQGFKARVETFNALEAYLSSLPGHRKENMRRGILSTTNFVDLIPVSTIWSGSPTNPCKFFPKGSPALVRAQSTSGEPYFFNLHTGDVGHTMVFGPNGAGKSVLFGLIASSFMKYQGAQVFVFDKGYSMYALTKAVGGNHMELGPDGIGLNPLGAIETLGRHWAALWIERICMASDLKLTSDQKQKLGGILASLNLGSKHLYDEFVAQVQDQEIKTVLQTFSSLGMQKDVINASSDALAFSAFNVFECGALLESGKDLQTAVLDYVFASIEARLTGAPGVILIDEAWSFLDNPIFSGRINTWLRELRKKNTSVVLATHGIEDMAKSSLAGILLKNTKTHIYLPDPSAKSTLGRSQYEAVGLTENQIDLIASIRGKRDYYICKEEEGRRVVDFALGPKALKIIAGTSIEESNRVRHLAAQDAENWWREYLADDAEQPAASSHNQATEIAEEEELVENV
jgi:type IV secretion system protein VirB4